jgi:hypothetical protein
VEYCSIEACVDHVVEILARPDIHAPPTTVFVAQQSQTAMRDTVAVDVDLPWPRHAALADRRAEKRLSSPGRGVLDDESCRQDGRGVEQIAAPIDVTRKRKGPLRGLSQGPDRAVLGTGRQRQPQHFAAGRRGAEVGEVSRAVRSDRDTAGEGQPVEQHAGCAARTLALEAAGAEPGTRRRERWYLATRSFEHVKRPARIERDVDDCGEARGIV